MSKNTKRTLLGFVLAIAALVLIAYLPAETEQMSRAAWQYLGCFVFMLVLIISRAVPDWAAVLCTMAVLVALMIEAIRRTGDLHPTNFSVLCQRAPVAIYRRPADMRVLLHDRFVDLLGSGMALQPLHRLQNQGALNGVSLHHLSSFLLQAFSY